MKAAHVQRQKATLRGVRKRLHFLLEIMLV
jgi:hypothetical protein